MKKIFALLILFIFALSGSVLSETFTWTNPTTYVDGSVISVAKQAIIKTHLYYGTVSTGPWTQFGLVSNGAITYTGTPPPDRGIQAYYTLAWELDGVQSAYFTPSLAYTRPLIACNPGSNFVIK
ncbi:MAG: hypothetical protein KKG99_09995 [Bacteroidetes bacterium]|nr:hypothetical protein [Bacteroidota bacterium]